VSEGAVSTPKQRRPRSRTPAPRQRLDKAGSRAAEVTQEAATGQIAAIAAYSSVPFEQVQARDRKAITQPVLIANGIEGIMIPAIASYTAIGHLQNAKLVLYSGSGEEFLFQHAKDFATEVTNFLSTWQNSTCTSSSPPL